MQQLLRVAFTQLGLSMLSKFSIFALALMTGAGQAAAADCGTAPAVYDVNDGQQELSVIDVASAEGPYGRTAHGKPLNVPLIVMKILTPEGKEEFIFGPSASWQWHAVQVEDIDTTEPVAFTGRTDDLFDAFLMRLDNRPDGESMSMEFKHCLPPKAQSAVPSSYVAIQKIPEIVPTASKPPIAVSLTTEKLERAAAESKARGERFDAANVADALVQKELAATAARQERKPNLLAGLFGGEDTPLPPARVSEPYAPKSLWPQEKKAARPVPSFSALSAAERKGLGEYIRAGNPADWQVAQTTSQRPQAKPAAKAASCSPKAGIWAAEADGARSIVYGTNGLVYPSDIYFEEWRSNKLAWRIKGQITCSNGVSTCYAAVPSKADRLDPETGEETGSKDEHMSHVVLETIHTNDDGIAEFAVFAGLSQQLYHDGGAQVEWFNGFAPSENGFPANPRNVYRFLGCRSSDALELLEAPRTQLSNWSAGTRSSEKEWLPLNLPTRECLEYGAYSKPCRVGPVFLDAAPDAQDLASRYGGDRISLSDLESVYKRFLAQLSELEAKDEAEPLGYIVFGPLGSEGPRGILMRGGVIDGNEQRLKGTEVTEFVASHSDPKEDDAREEFEQYRLRQQMELPTCPPGMAIGCNLAADDMTAEGLEATYFRDLGADPDAVLRAGAQETLSTVLAKAEEQAGNPHSKLVVTMEDTDPDVAKVRGYRRVLNIQVFEEVDGEINIKKLWQLWSLNPA